MYAFGRGKCPMCNKDREGFHDNKHFPFCSERCKMIDLWSWLNGDYGFIEAVVSDNEKYRDDE